MKFLNSYPKHKYLLPAGFVLVFAIIGVIILFVSHAATPYAAIEAETGATGGATSTSDSKASGGSYLQFGTEGPTTPPPSSDGCTYNGVIAPCIGSATTGASGWGSPVFDDEFNETNGLDTNLWSTSYFGYMNNVNTSPSNVSVTGGNLVLELSSSSEGAAVTSTPNGNTFNLADGEYYEGRIDFPGSGTTVDNWPAFWATDNGCWPEGGEIDVAEGLGTLTSNYQYGPSCSYNCGCDTPQNSGTIPGDWAAGWHTYGVDREAGTNTIYWDGKKVYSYTTYDNGAPEFLVINVGQGEGGPTVTGPSSDVLVDYVRVWQKQ